MNVKTFALYTNRYKNVLCFYTLKYFCMTNKTTRNCIYYVVTPCCSLNGTIEIKRAAQSRILFSFQII